MAFPSFLARGGPGEELLARPDRAGRLGLVAQRLVGLAVPRAHRQPLAVGVHRRAPEVGVDHARAFASLGDRRDDERLTDAGYEVVARPETGAAAVDAAMTSSPRKRTFSQGFTGSRMVI